MAGFMWKMVDVLMDVLFSYKPCLGNVFAWSFIPCQCLFWYVDLLLSLSASSQWWQAGAYLHCNGQLKCIVPGGSSNYEIVRVPGGSGPVYHSSQRLNQSPGLSRQAPLTAVTRSNTIRIELQFRKTSSKHHEKTKGNVLCGGAMKLLKLHTKSRKSRTWLLTTEPGFLHTNHLHQIRWTLQHHS